jgi:hypothetical protein
LGRSDRSSSLSTGLNRIVRKFFRAPSKAGGKEKIVHTQRVSFDLIIPAGPINFASTEAFPLLFKGLMGALFFTLPAA